MVVPENVEANTFRTEIAILPLEDKHLFRAERKKLREQLFSELASRLPNHRLVRLPQFDKELVAVSTKTGARCAHDHVDAAAIAERRQRATARVIHVMGTKSSPEQLWVDIHLRSAKVASFAAPSDPKLGRMERYAQSFSQLEFNPSGGLVGGLSGRMDKTMAVSDGGVTLCETKPFAGCKKSSTDWSDAVAKLSSCFDGQQEKSAQVLIQGQPKGATCELSNLDDTGGAQGKLESCLCSALSDSAAVAKSAERRNLSVDFLAPELKKLPRPELRVLETSTNLSPKEEWHVPTNALDDRKLPAVKRMIVGNLDALGAPLSRCKAKAGTTLLAQLTLSESGQVSGTSLVSGSASRALRACVEKELKTVGFSCSDDGKEARLLVAIEWPTWPAKP